MSPDAIAYDVAIAHGLPVGDVMSRSRMPHLCRARADIYRRLREQGWSYPAIGRWAGRDHATIMNALRGK
jgi:chromosomal replication initiation ATPase DnaA